MSCTHIGKGAPFLLADRLGNPLATPWQYLLVVGNWFGKLATSFLLWIDRVYWILPLKVKVKPRGGGPPVYRGT